MLVRSSFKLIALFLAISISGPCLAQDANPDSTKGLKATKLVTSEKLKGEITVKGQAQTRADHSVAGGPPAVSKPSLIHKFGARLRSLANFVFDVRGFDWSKEGANAIQDENISNDSESAREYLARKRSDDLDIQTTVLILQLAMYIDSDQQKSSQALVRLEKLIGVESAHDFSVAIKQLQFDDINLDDAKLKLDFEQRSIVMKELLTKTAETDVILLDASKRLSKYNHRGKLIQTTAKVVYPILGVASFTPTLVAPVAEVALLSFMMTTGGPEQDKLLKEIYLAKIMHSRCNLLNEKVHLIVETMDMAVLGKNKRLLSCAREMVKDLTDEKTAAAIVAPYKNTSTEVKPIQVAGERSLYSE